MSEWSRKSAGKPTADPHLPDMRKAEGETYTANNDEKAEILGAYRPIALENTLAKLMEKIVTTRMVRRRKSCYRGIKWAGENNAPLYPL